MLGTALESGVSASPLKKSSSTWSNYHCFILPRKRWASPNRERKYGVLSETKALGSILHFWCLTFSSFSYCVIKCLQGWLMTAAANSINERHLRSKLQSRFWQAPSRDKVTPTPLSPCARPHRRARPPGKLPLPGQPGHCTARSRTHLLPTTARDRRLTSRPPLPPPSGQCRERRAKREPSRALPKPRLGAQREHGEQLRAAPRYGETLLHPPTKTKPDPHDTNTKLVQNERQIKPRARNPLTRTERGRIFWQLTDLS